MNNFGLNRECCSNKQIANYNDDRFFGGGFLVPFLAGAVVSAPFWYLGANKSQQQVYYQQPYYQQPYPVYYPYTAQNNDNYPTYYPYPQYR